MFTQEQIDAAATAIVQSRGMRRGVPVITNVLDMLPENMKQEVREEAEAALKAVLPNGLPDAAESEEFCANCEDELSPEVVEAVLNSDEKNGVQCDASGNMLIGGRFYCPDCAPHVQKCRVCGCTNEMGCPGGCGWIETDLCSRCFNTDLSKK